MRLFKIKIFQKDIRLLNLSLRVHFNQMNFLLKQKQNKKQHLILTFRERKEIGLNVWAWKTPTKSGFQTYRAERMSLITNYNNAPGLLATF